MRVGATILGCGCFLATIVFAAAAAPRTESPISVVLNVPRTCVSRTGELRLEVRLENRSSEPVTLFGHLLFGASGGMILNIEDKNANRVRPPFLLDEQVPPTAIRNPASYVILQRNHYLGTLLNEPAKDLFPTAGTFILSVHYLSPVAQRHFVGPNPFSRERGIVRSNSVTITVE